MKRPKLKRVIVNKHLIKKNAKHGTHDPVIAVHSSGEKPKYGHEVDVVIDGRVVATFIYRPEKPQSCGATVWFDTRAELRVRETKRGAPRKTTPLDEILDAAACTVDSWPAWMQKKENRVREPVGNRGGR